MQILSLIICVIAPTIVNLAGIIKTILGDVSPTIENAKYYYLMISGNWTMGCLIAVYVFFMLLENQIKRKFLIKVIFIIINHIAGIGFVQRY